LPHPSRPIPAPPFAGPSGEWISCPPHAEQSGFRTQLVQPVPRERDAPKFAPMIGSSTLNPTHRIIVHPRHASSVSGRAPAVRRDGTPSWISRPPRLRRRASASPVPVVEPDSTACCSLAPSSARFYACGSVRPAAGECARVNAWCVPTPPVVERFRFQRRPNKDMTRAYLIAQRFGVPLLPRQPARRHQHSQAQAGAQGAVHDVRQVRSRIEDQRAGRRGHSPTWRTDFGPLMAHHFGFVAFRGPTVGGAFRVEVEDLHP
jgi:hypothetical protein